MGLDMYIHRYPKYSDNYKKNRAIISFINWIQNGLEYSFKDWCGSYINPSDLPNTSTLIKILSSHPIDHEDNVIKEVAYWRKANHIHKWFVDNIQDGVDDCQEHRPIAREDLITLRDACDKVIEDNRLASKLLPTMPGFFFGGIDYDDWYYESIKGTSELCEKLIEETDFDRYELRYESSW